LVNCFGREGGDDAADGIPKAIDRPFDGLAEHGRQFLVAIAFSIGSKSGLQGESASRIKGL
jgi:hypothetical protein